MADSQQKDDNLEVIEATDGSATVDVPETLMDGVDNDANPNQNHADDDVHDDDGDLQEAKRNRRRAKKDLVRKTNQEKDVRLQQLQRENEEFKRRLGQLERNTKAENVVRIEKGIEDAQTRLEYAKMKLAEATQNQDGQGVVEAQTLWQNAQDEVRNLKGLKDRADQDLKRPQQAPVDPNVQRNASDWVRRNGWYDPNLRDSDSRVAKKIDELMSTQGWDPADADYWDEFDSRLQKELPHRYNGSNDDDTRSVRRPRNVVASAGREASAAYGGSNRSQFILSPERVKAMKDAGAWDNPERKAKMIKHFIAYDRTNRN
jgi:hypothetical protein